MYSTLIYTSNCIRFTNSVSGHYLHLMFAKIQEDSCSSKPQNFLSSWRYQLLKVRNKIGFVKIPKKFKMSQQSSWSKANEFMNKLWYFAYDQSKLLLLVCPFVWKEAMEHVFTVLDFGRKFFEYVFDPLNIEYEENCSWDPVSEELTMKMSTSVYYNMVYTSELQKGSRGNTRAWLRDKKMNFFSQETFPMPHAKVWHILRNIEEVSRKSVWGNCWRSFFWTKQVLWEWESDRAVLVLSGHIATRTIKFNSYKEIIMNKINL